jgi:hypothetical protein
MAPRPQGNNNNNERARSNVVPNQQPQPQQPQPQQDHQLVRANLPLVHGSHPHPHHRPPPHHQAHMENNAENADRPLEEQAQEEQRRQYPAIQDQDEWLRQYGLRGEPHYGAESYTNQKEAKERIQDHDDYQAQLHAKLFEGPTEAEKIRHAQLMEWSNHVVKIEASTGAPIECNLGHLASHSDTVFTMAESRPHFERSSSKGLSVNIPLLLSLRDYSNPAVLEFFELLDDSGVYSKAEIHIGAVPKEDYAVECCQIANYLQCNALLDDVLVPLLIKSVDSANCLSLYQLADQLNLPALLEASVNHMMRSLGSVEEHEIWGDLTPELQSRIQAIQQILQSSNRRQLFFSSFEEYLALFAEQVDYYRERLEDAIHQQDQHPQQSPGWQYAQSKIDQQQGRVRILKLVLQEQKKLFRPRRQSPL